MTKYYSESKKKYIEIESMPDQYVRNAFIKLNQKTEYKKDAYETLWDISQDKDKTIERLREQIKDIYDRNSRRGHNYVFSEIPNDPDGERFVGQMKKYLNKDTYKLRVRGQHLKEGLNWREHTYGQSIDNSKCLRIYVEEKYK